MSTEYFLIGCGLFNCTLARLFAEAGHKVHIIEARDHIGGNCFDLIDEKTGYRYHKYGPHIFHFSDNKWFEFLSRFGTLRPFHHSVKSVFGDAKFQIPVNLDTINQFFNVNLKPSEVAAFLESRALKIDNPKNMEDQLLAKIGRELYEAFFKNYTQKQWGKSPSELPGSTIQRIPVRMNYNSSYYNKPYSYIPEEGFTPLINNIINHENIDIELKHFSNLDEIIGYTKSGKVVYTGELDKLFDYKYGRLEYRALRFELEHIKTKDFQGLSVINYPESKYRWTRICEPKHFPHIENINGFNNSETLIIKEISKLKEPEDEAYYPIADKKNLELFNRYAEEANAIENLILAGRLGTYTYTDMEQTLSKAFELFENV